MSIPLIKTSTLVFLLVICLTMTGCFTTLQTAKLRKGFQFSLNAARLTDQERRGQPQGPDIVGLLTPSYGFGKSSGIEFGVPFGWYWEEGMKSWSGNGAGSPGSNARHFTVLPYFKIALNQHKKDKIAFLMQFAYVIPMSMTLIYSHDYPRWTPYVSLKTIFSTHQVTEAIHVDRYHQPDQVIWVLAIGVEFNVQNFPLIELGVMRNSFEDREIYGTERHVTQYDWYLGIKASL